MKREIVNRRVVMCDFDELITFKTVKNRWKYISKQLWPGVKFRLCFEYSPSAKGFHFWAVAARDIIGFFKHNDSLRVLLAQCLMGSDIKRERANLARITAGIEDWNVLFSSRRSAVDKLKKMGILKP